IVAQVGNTSLNMGQNKSWKELVEQRYIVAGSPATVRQQLEELARSLRVGHLAIGGHIGSSPIELTNRSTYLLATEVMPHLRPIWSEYEDHWSPKPLPRAERVVPGGQNEAARRAAERPAAAGARRRARASSRSAGGGRPARCWVPVTAAPALCCPAP